MTPHAIRTARVPARLSRRHALRPMLEQWLAGTDLARHGLPAQAIVLVRRMAAGWAALSTSGWPTRYADLQAVLARAARPARGELLGDAVWFADEAELLACLARDALTGDLALRWWWPLVLRECSTGAAVSRWTQSPRLVPAALARLPIVQARTWLQAWTSAQRQQLVLVLAQQFPVAPEVVGVTVHSGATASPSPASDRRVPEPRASKRAPAASEQAERVLQFALALAHDPLAWSHADAGVQLVRGDTSCDALLPESPTSHELAAPVPAAPAPQRTPAITRLVSPGQQAQPALQEPGPATWQGATEQAVPAETATTPAGADPAAITSLAPTPMARSSAEPATLEQSPTARRIATQHGGVLFLLNAALHMGLYGDFTQPRRPGSLDVSPWRFLLACGRMAGGRAFADDELAGWLRGRAPRDRGVPRLRHPHLWHDLQQRLLLALDLPDPREIASVLLRLPARLEDRGEHVDLHLELATLPLAVRLAGLDRDPGWIPAAGCDVRFHFH